MSSPASSPDHGTLSARYLLGRTRARLAGRIVERDLLLCRPRDWAELVAADPALAHWSLHPCGTLALAVGPADSWAVAHGAPLDPPVVLARVRDWPTLCRANPSLLGFAVVRLGQWIAGLQLLVLATTTF